MKRLLLYLLLLAILLSQTVLSQTYGTSAYGSGPYGGVYQSNADQKENNDQPIQESPPIKNVSVIYVDNSSRITNYIDNSTHETKYVNQSSTINNEAPDTNIIFNLTITLFGITALSVIIWEIFVHMYFKRKQKNQNR